MVFACRYIRFMANESRLEGRYFGYIESETLKYECYSTDNTPMSWALNLPGTSCATTPFRSTIRSRRRHRSSLIRWYREYVREKAKK